MTLSTPEAAAEEKSAVMRLNTLKPAAGAKKVGKRLGRGIGSGKGKTSGKGHKGFLARAGGGRRLGFEGGQMPQQRRVPKSGFTSAIAQGVDEIRLHELAKVQGTEISLTTLREAGLITRKIKQVKVILAGKLEKAIVIKKDVSVTRGAREAIEAVGGKVEVE